MMTFLHTAPLTAPPACLTRGCCLFTPRAPGPLSQTRRGLLGFLVPQSSQGNPIYLSPLPNIPGLGEKGPCLLPFPPHEPRQHTIPEETLPVPRGGPRSRSA